MVRLKHITDSVGNNATLFQFLNGSIKAQFLAIFPVLHKQFQFLNGSIKAVLEITFANYKSRFNSSMVRLKLRHLVWCPNVLHVSIPQWFD